MSGLERCPQFSSVLIEWFPLCSISLLVCACVRVCVCVCVCACVRACVCVCVPCAMMIPGAESAEKTPSLAYSLVSMWKCSEHRGGSQLTGTPFASTSGG